MTTKLVDARPLNRWLKKLSWALPLFFLLKGLAWLALPALLAFYGLEWDVTSR
jgi:hypothetical protein